MLLTQTVHQTKHVSIENAKIPVQVSVELMPTAESEIMFLSVSVTKDILEIPSPTAIDL